MTGVSFEEVEGKCLSARYEVAAAIATWASHVRTRRSKHAEARGP